MFRSIVATTLAGAALISAGAAQAGTHWAVGINLPVATVVMADAPRYVAMPPAPVYYAAPPVVYTPAPRYAVREVYYAPAPHIVYETTYRERRWNRHHDHWHHHDRRDRWDSDRDAGPRHGR